MCAALKPGFCTRCRDDRTPPDAERRTADRELPRDGVEARIGSKVSDIAWGSRQPSANCDS